MATVTNSAVVGHCGLRCNFKKDDGRPSASPPLQDADHCFMHSPDHAAEIDEARRLGGVRRRRETVVSTSYDFQGLETIADIRRVLQIAIIDTLEQPNSLARSRTLSYLVLYNGSRRAQSCSVKAVGRDEACAS